MVKKQSSFKTFPVYCPKKKLTFILLVGICGVLVFSQSIFAQTTPLQSYQYEDSTCIITIQSQYFQQVPDSASIMLRVQSKIDSLYIFPDFFQADNYEGNILIIDFGGFYEAKLDHPEAMIILSCGDQWQRTKRLITKCYDTTRPLNITLSIGYILSKQTILDQRYLSMIHYSEEGNRAQMSSLIVDSCLERIDLRLFQLNEIH